MTKTPRRFPKVQSPYNRSENSSGNYVVSDSMNKDLSWVFERAEEVEAVEKIDGTNVAVYVDDGVIVDASTRIGDRSMNYVNPYVHQDKRYVVRAIQNSVGRGYTDDLNEGWNFGEVVGPHMQENPHELEKDLFIPFEWLRRKCEYRSYGDYPTDFESISEWFENGIFSLFHSKMHGTDFDQASVRNDTFVEGIVFVHPDFDGVIRSKDLNTFQHEEFGTSTHQLAKLRRDMFTWHI